MRGMREDFLVWSQFLKSFNGISFWRDDRWLQADFQVNSDMARSLGFSIYFQGRWCSDTWPDMWYQYGTTRDLTFLNFFPIVGALWLWADEW